MKNVIQKQNTKKETALYIIDDQLRVVYANEVFRKQLSKDYLGKFCYDVFAGRPAQCKRCPLRPENHGKAIIYSQLLEEWVSISTGVIEWPGVGPSTMILIDSIDKQDKGLFSDMVERFDYDELLELNYFKDTYHVVYANGQYKTAVGEEGFIRDTIYRIGETQIHPEDKEALYRLWRLELIGQPGTAEELMTVRHGEFRRLQPDGTYSWVQQVFMPVRQSGENNIFVMSFFIKLGNQLPLNSGSDNEWEENGLHRKQPFFQRVEEMLQQDKSDRLWCMISIDIENLKLFNEWYGREAGDKLLHGIADCLNHPPVGQPIVAGYFDDDDFALLMPYDESLITQLYCTIKALLQSYSNKTGFLPAFGLYRIADKTQSVFTMYDRAELARAEVRGNYAVRMKEFDNSMLEKLESTYVLYSDVQQALKQKEFFFVLQPKCNMENSKIIGAEALVRWNSPEKGIVSPGVFIPFLEKSGFIAELDVYIWEEVCKWQRQRLDAGQQTVPISVNVSRVDLYSMDVPAFLGKLMKTYNLPTSLLEIEITESTYTEDNAFISEVVSELRKAGFQVMMDDFGSGYSSLNMLKDVELDVLKLDMRFLDVHEGNVGKGIGILEAVRNMASLLGIKIIVEGVETAEQKEFLLRMGCGYAQGYYFYRPLSAEQFAQLLLQDDIVDVEDYRERVVEQLYLKDLLSKDTFSEIMINNMLGAVAFYEVYENQISVRRYNEHYAMLLGNETFHSANRLNFEDHLHEDDYDKIFKMFELARLNRHDGAEEDIRRWRPDGTMMWLHMRTFFISEQDGHAVYYSSVSDITDIKQVNEILTEQNEILRFLNNDMPGGYYQIACNATYDFLHISQRFLDIVGYTRAEIEALFDNKFWNMVHPDDRALIAYSAASLEQNGGNYLKPYRIHSKAGYISIITMSRLVKYENKTFFHGILMEDFVTNHDPWLEESSALFLKNNVLNYNARLAPAGLFLADVDGNHQIFYTSESLLDMLGYTQQSFEDKFNNCSENLVYEADRMRVIKESEEQIQHKNIVNTEFRMKMADGTLKWVYCRGRLVNSSNGKRLFYVCVVDYDYLREKYKIQMDCD